MKGIYFIAVFIVASLSSLCVATLDAQERKLNLINFGGIPSNISAIFSPNRRPGGDRDDSNRDKESSRERPSDRDRDSNRDRDSERRKQNGARSIPGTNLKTRTFYRISMKRFPYGVVTTTPQKNFANGYRYLQIDNNRDRERKYRNDGDLAKDAQWEFVPVSSNHRYNWYKLRNRARPKEYATWSVGEFVGENSEQNFLILESNYPGRRSKSEFLFRPVKVKQDRDDNRGSERDRDYYQLILKEDRSGMITYSQREYDTESYFLQVDNSNDERHMRRYEKGNDKYDTTLFSLELADREDIDDEEDIEDNNVDKVEEDK